jgi:hypothetical protein
MARIILQQSGDKDVAGTRTPAEEPVATAQEGEETSTEDGEGQ